MRVAVLCEKLQSRSLGSDNIAPGSRLRAQSPPPTESRRPTALCGVDAIDTRDLSGTIFERFGIGRFDSKVAWRSPSFSQIDFDRRQPARRCRRLKGLSFSQPSRPWVVDDFTEGNYGSAIGAGLRALILFDDFQDDFAVVMVAAALSRVRIDLAVRPCLPIIRPRSSLATLSSKHRGVLAVVLRDLDGGGIVDQSFRQVLNQILHETDLSAARLNSLGSFLISSETVWHGLAPFLIHAAIFSRSILTPPVLARGS